MARVRDLGESAKKWADRAGAASGDYARGAANPRRPWAAATAAANENYKQGVQRAANENRFQKGVNAAGDEKYQRGVAQKGEARYGAGVAVAQPDYAAGFEPYRRVIENVQLPPRKPTGDPSNINRVAAIANALSAARTGKGAR